MSTSKGKVVIAGQLNQAASALPFPDMPYGVAPAWSFTLAEWSMLAMLLLCAAHALSKGRQGAIQYLLGGFLFGLLLEYLEVLSHSYTYGPFHLMLGKAPVSIPVCIGAGWGIILYTSRLYSDTFRLPLVAAAALDTLLALNIDLSMDVVAYRLHMWHWYWTGTGLNPLHAQWFGVPYGNFVGWATVVFSYSAFSRIWEGRLLGGHAASFARSQSEVKGRKNFREARFTAVAVLSLLSSQAVLFCLETWVWAFLRKAVGLTSGIRLLLIIATMCALVARAWRQRRGLSGRVPALAILVPCWFHGYFLFCFIWFRIFRENAWLTCAALANIAAGVALHLLPVLDRTKALRSDSEGDQHVTLPDSSVSLR